jgi:hypothetical protein
VHVPSFLQKMNCFVADVTYEGVHTEEQLVELDTVPE